MKISKEYKINQTSSVLKRPKKQKNKIDKRTIVLREIKKSLKHKKFANPNYNVKSKIAPVQQHRMLPANKTCGENCVNWKKWHCNMSADAFNTYCRFNLNKFIDKNETKR